MRPPQLALAFLRPNRIFFLNSMADLVGNFDAIILDLTGNVRISPQPGPA
jgi:hypothetical protein